MLEVFFFFHSWGTGSPTAIPREALHSAATHQESQKQAASESSATIVDVYIVSNDAVLAISSSDDAPQQSEHSSATLAHDADTWTGLTTESNHRRWMGCCGE